MCPTSADSTATKTSAINAPASASKRHNPVGICFTLRRAAGEIVCEVRL